MRMYLGFGMALYGFMAVNIIVYIVEYLIVSFRNFWQCTYHHVLW